MCEQGAARQCSQCCFCREIGEALCCVKGPPEFDKETGEARWPRVRPTDYCGAFRADAPSGDSSLVTREAQSQFFNNQSSLINHQCPSPNHQSSIIHNQLPALPVYEDAYGPYCRIPLTQNRFAKVDPEDYLWLAQFRWCCKVGRDNCYAVRHIQERGRTKRIQMHRQIMATPRHLICDHKNHDGLDNRRQNLRNCTTEQNNANRRKRGTNHGSRAPSSQYIGVTWCPRRKKWVSYIKHKGKSRNLGLFEIEEEAARAHDKAAWEQWGEYANLNFPDEYPGHPAARQTGGDSCPVIRRTKTGRAINHRATEHIEKTDYPQINADVRRLGRATGHGSQVTRPPAGTLPRFNAAPGRRTIRSCT